MTAATGSDGDWPAAGLEHLGACPVCSSAKRELMFDDLRDRIFFCAPGEWTMYRCADCRSSYLDPRPNLDTIGIAYDQYYTHDQVSVTDLADLGRLARLRRMLANGYRNWRFTTDLRPYSKLGVPAAMVLPGLRRLLDRQHRHLPRGTKGRVLDVGFGAGTFLDDATAAGWDAVGTDIDPKVIDAARKRGLKAVVGTVDEVDGPFEYITLSHTIEHFHDPVRVLERCNALLRPGGTIWIETPNSDALGLRQFGADWRGLEPPRHLVIFTHGSLKAALERANFVDVCDYAQPSGIVKALYAMSENIRLRRPPSDAVQFNFAMKLAIAAATAIGRTSPRSREFIGMLASRKADA